MVLSIIKRKGLERSYGCLWINGKVCESFRKVHRKFLKVTRRFVKVAKVVKILNLKKKKPQLMVTIILCLLSYLLGTWFELCYFICTKNPLSLPFGALCHLVPAGVLVNEKSCLSFGALCHMVLVSVLAGMRACLCCLGLFCHLDLIKVIWDSGWNISLCETRF